MTAVALQVVGQYAIPNNFTQSSRPNDQAAAGSHSYNRDLRGSGYHQSSVEEILNNPVLLIRRTVQSYLGKSWWWEWTPVCNAGT